MADYYPDTPEGNSQRIQDSLDEMNNRLKRPVPERTFSEKVTDTLILIAVIYLLYNLSVFIYDCFQEDPYVTTIVLTVLGVVLFLMGYLAPIS